MNLDDLIKNGFVERTYSSVIDGVAYSEIHYLDDEWNYVNKDDATCLLIKEFNDKGKKINELIMRQKDNISGRSR